MAISKVQAIINGVTTDLVYNPTTSAYEKQVTAPSKSSYNINSGHYYPITVKAIDTAGNSTTLNDSDSTFGNNLKLKVNEKVVPVTTITSPTEGQILTNSTPTINWKVTDDDSGVNPNTIGITINSGSKITSGITKTAITGGYQCSYVISAALTDGAHTIKIDAQDFDQNNAVQRTVNFKVDTIPPVLSVLSPVNNLITNNAAVAVSGTTNDATSNPCTVTATLNGGAATSITVNADGSFSKTFTLREGINSIIIVSTDRAGKSSSVTRTATLDTSAPIFTSINIPSQVSTGAVFTISVKVTD